MSETETVRRPRAPRVAPPAQGKPTLPATDAADSDTPLTLSADAVEGTRDRLLAFQWTEQGELVRRRPDGVYERVHTAVAAPAPPETYQYYPDVELLDRRVLDPQLDRDVTIQFKDETNLRPGQTPKYYKRWVDTRVPHRYLTLTQRGGYKVATWDMLADKNDIGDRSEGLGAEVSRGEKGQYKLLFMPYAKWMEIKTAQARKRTDRERTEMKSLATSAASTIPGADQIASSFRGEIKELPPMNPEAFASSGLPKDLQSGDGTVLE